MVRLLEAAIAYAKEHGACIVEGYPIEADEKEVAPVSSFTGIVSTFKEAGFVEVARRSQRQPIMRYYIVERQ